MIKWATFNRMHEKSAKKAAPVFGKALMRHFAKMLEAAIQNGFQNLDNVITRVDQSDITKAFILVYQGAGLPMAYLQFDGLVGKKRRRFVEMPDGTKVDVFEKWKQMLTGIVLDETIPARNAILTTSQEIFKKFVTGALEEGQTVTDIATGLRERFTDLQPWRSFNIARTETLSAMNYGGEIGAAETGLEYRKTWLSAMDNRTRPEHMSVDGPIAEHESFNVGGEMLRFPGDPAASVYNRVNCRCTVIREVVEI